MNRFLPPQKYFKPLHNETVQKYNLQNKKINSLITLSYNQYPTL